MEYRDPITLKRHPVHERTYQIGDTLALEKSIAEKGIIEPIRINPAGFILSGVRRNQAAINLNMKSVPVVAVDLPEEGDSEDILASNIHRVKIWLEVSNEIREKRAIIGKRQGERTDKSNEGKINTQKQIADELGIKQNVVRVLELIGDQPEHRELLARDTETNTIFKLETDYKKRLAAAPEVDADEFPVIDLEPHRCILCQSYPRRIVTDYLNKLMRYVDESDTDI